MFRQHFGAVSYATKGVYMTSLFLQKLEKNWQRGTRLCVGLDTDPAKLPHFLRGDVVAFNDIVISCTRHVAAAYKVNAAFYEGRGVRGMNSMHETFYNLRDKAGGAVLIYDAKRADIGNTNVGYAAAAFDWLNADAVTVNPYLGAEALTPFLKEMDRGIIVLCRTSNPGAGEFQDLLLDEKIGAQQARLFEKVAKRVAEDWNVNGNCAVVVGATAPLELERVRNIVGDLPILIPGVGTQGGTIKDVAAFGGERVLVNASRGIIYPWKQGNEPVNEDALRAVIRTAAEAHHTDIEDAYFGPGTQPEDQMTGK